MAAPRRHGWSAAGIGVVVLVLASVLAAAGPAQARYSPKKAIWGPVTAHGASQFPIYRDLGVGVYELQLDWSEVARQRPAHATNPADPAYRWPADVEFAVREAPRYGIKVLLQVGRSPRWANGGRRSNWAPRRPRDFARFVTAAARRYPTVHRWLVWGEPAKRKNFMPMPVQRPNRRLSRRQQRGPRLYARILDAAYGALKRASRRNVVIGGNTVTVGDVYPRSFIKAMRLPNGRRPRMSLYGHNPFTAREPDLSNSPRVEGSADFSDLDTLGRWLDRYGYRGAHRRRLRLFVDEFVIPTDNFNYEFGFYVDRQTQAEWLSAALRITRRWWRISGFGWLGLYDETPNAKGDQVNRGLLDWQGRRKPSYYAYRDG